MTPVEVVGALSVPAAVRETGGEAAYRGALGFEGMLLDRLSEQLVEGSGLEDSPYAATITESFSASLLQGGGLGLAEQLYAAMQHNDGFALQSSQAPPAGRRNS